MQKHEKRYFFLIHSSVLSHDNSSGNNLTVLGFRARLSPLEMKIICTGFLLEFFRLLINELLKLDKTNQLN